MTLIYCFKLIIEKHSLKYNAIKFMIDLQLLHTSKVFKVMNSICFRENAVILTTAGSVSLAFMTMALKTRSILGVYITTTMLG